jgi:Fic family protein
LYRTTDDIVVEGEPGVALHVPPLAASISGEMKRLCAFANKADGAFEHPVIRASILHFWLGYLHPFADGNGRTARALFYLYMLKHGYWLFEYLSISRVILGRRAQYERAYLHAEHDDADLTYFLVFKIAAVEKALTDLTEYLKRKMEEDRGLLARLLYDRSLNHRQRALLSRALEDPHHVFTIESHLRSHAVSYPTARADMLGLAERGYVTMARKGRAFTFQAADGLRSRLGRA